MGKQSKKEIIYLDQCFISEIVKLVEQGNKKVNQIHGELYELLHKGFIEEKTVVPSSFYHQYESCFAPYLKNEVAHYLKHLGQLSFNTPQELLNRQILNTAKKFMGETCSIINTNDAFSDKPDRRARSFYIHVDSNLERLFTKEGRNSITSRIESYRHTIKKSKNNYNNVLNKIVKPYIDQVAQLPIEGYIRKEIFKGDNHHFMNFINSEDFKNIPYIKIISTLWTEVLTGHSERKIKTGDKEDIEIISAFLPYVDIFTTDSYMSSLIKNARFDELYETEIYNSKKTSLEKFCSKLEYIIKNHESVNKPVFTIFVLSDNIIKDNSFNFFKKLNNQIPCDDTEWIEIFAFKDNSMPRLYDKFIGMEIPFYGYQFDINVIEIDDDIGKSEIQSICKSSCRSDRFILIDRYFDVPDFFVEGLILMCNKNFNKYHGFEIISIL